MPPTTRTVRVTSIQEFTAYVDENCQGAQFLYRGQQENWPLLPKIGRVRPRSPGVLDLEQVIFREFTRQSLPHLSRIPTSEWDWLALAQHHGLATRLLDWTENPLAALWFAVCQPPRSTTNGVTWVMKSAAKDVVTPRDMLKTAPFRVSRTRVFQPNMVAQRIVAQHGWFTVHRYIEGKAAFVPLERNNLFRERLTKIEIPSSSFATIRYQLARFGMNRLQLFPDLDALCGHIQWLYTYLEDERGSEAKSKPRALEPRTVLKDPYVLEFLGLSRAPRKKRPLKRKLELPGA